MLIATTEPCGCGPWRSDHWHPDCLIVRERQETNEETKRLLEDFRREVEQ